MIISLDLFHGNPMATVYIAGKTPPEGFTFPCYTPWKNLSFADRHEEESFRNYLRRIISFLRSEYSEEVRYAIFIIPHAFTFPQREKLRCIAKSCGIRWMRLGYAGEFAACTAHPDGLTNGLFCRADAQYVELELVQCGDNMTEVLSITHVKNTQAQDSAAFARQLKEDIRQLLRDAECSAEQLEHLYIMGSCSDLVISTLEENLGIRAGFIRNIATRGAVGYWREQTDMGMAAHLLLQATPYNFFAVLGEHGEEGKLIPRYCAYPSAKGCNLLVSTEKTLNIYEGNFPNRDLDTLICSFPLENAEEGHEILCMLSIDADGSARIVVTDDQDEILLDEQI